MSKWYRIYIPISHMDDLIEIEDFLNELNLESRWKRCLMFKINIPPKGKDDYKILFKFKDEMSAMAFKLRWT